MIKRKIWIGVGVFVLAGAGSAPVKVFATDEVPAAGKHVHGPGMFFVQIAQTAIGEGGEGGEAGINVEAASRDPFAYGVALQVIAAHYHAGLAAYEAGERDAGAQMFAHGQAEVYAEMEDTFKKLGVTGLGAKLEAAVNAASGKKPVPEVRRHAKAVLKSLAAAEKKAPKSDSSVNAIKAQLVAELLDRAAAQYVVAQKDTNLESYLDGLGFAVAAREQSKAVLPWLRKQDRMKEAAVKQVLALAAKAYPSVKRNKPNVAEGDFLAAASKAKLAVSNLK